MGYKGEGFFVAGKSDIGTLQRVRNLMAEDDGLDIDKESHLTLLS
jgi:hypothetical protein